MGSAVMCIFVRITYPPKLAIFRLVNSLKGVSSRLIRKKALSEH